MNRSQFTPTEAGAKGCAGISPPLRTLPGGADPEDAPENPGRRAMLRTVLGGAALTVTGAAATKPGSAGDSLPLSPEFCALLDRASAAGARWLHADDADDQAGSSDLSPECRAAHDAFEAAVDEAAAALAQSVLAAKRYLSAQAAVHPDLLDEIGSALYFALRGQWRGGPVGGRSWPEEAGVTP